MSQEVKRRYVRTEWRRGFGIVELKDEPAAAVAIQTRYRLHACRSKYIRMQPAAICIQASFRRYTERCRYLAAKPRWVYGLVKVDEEELALAESEIGNPFARSDANGGENAAVDSATDRNINPETQWYDKLFGEELDLLQMQSDGADGGSGGEKIDMTAEALTSALSPEYEDWYAAQFTDELEQLAPQAQAEAAEEEVEQQRQHEEQQQQQAEQEEQRALVAAEAARCDDELGAFEAELERAVAEAPCEIDITEYEYGSGSDSDGDVQVPLDIFAFVFKTGTRYKRTIRGGAKGMGTSKGSSGQEGDEPAPESDSTTLAKVGISVSQAVVLEAASAMP